MEEMYSWGGICFLYVVGEMCCLKEKGGVAMSCQQIFARNVRGPIQIFASM